MKHFVFAGTLQQAQEHARESGLDHGQWIYADRRHKLQGLHPSDIITHRVGTWDENGDVVQAWRFYQELCATHGISIE